MDEKKLKNIMRALDTLEDARSRIVFLECSLSMGFDGWGNSAQDGLVSVLEGIDADVIEAVDMIKAAQAN